MKVTNILKTSVMTLLMASTCLIASTVQAQVKSATAEEEATAKALVEYIKERQEMTDLQKKMAWKKFKGKSVVFKGVVRNVGLTTFTEKLYVSLTVDKISAFERLNIQFNIPDSFKDTVISWRKGETHTIRGKITGQGDPEDDAECSDAEVIE